METGAMPVAIINPHLQNQREHALALKRSGFSISTNPSTAVSKDEVVLVSGPWYAYRKQIGHPKLLMIDRAWWNDPESVSICHVHRDGRREYPEPYQEKRRTPELKDWKTREQSALVILDYGQEYPQETISAAKQRFKYVRFRRHPSENHSELSEPGRIHRHPSENHSELSEPGRIHRHPSENRSELSEPGRKPKQVSLDAHLALSDVAIGWKSSALVHAATQGVPVICLDEQNPVLPVSVDSLDATMYRGPRQEWLHGLACAQVTMTEIADGYVQRLFPGLFREVHDKRSATS